MPGTVKTVPYGLQNDPRVMVSIPAIRGYYDNCAVYTWCSPEHCGRL